MLRRIPAIILLLALAVVMNWAVAWGAVWLRAMTFDPRGSPVTAPVLSLQAQQLWEAEFGPSVFVAGHGSTQVASRPAQPGPGQTIYWVIENHRDGFGCNVMSLTDNLRQAPTAIEMLQAGWPMPALRCERVFGSKQYQVKHAWTAFANNGTRAGGMVLPCQPMWIGAIVNTALYAMLLVLLWLGLHSARRARRRRRNRCVACGYDLRAATGTACPECGRTATASAT